MGHDISFHPVALAELQHFVFDVIDNPRLLKQRVDELSDDPNTRHAIDAQFRLTLKAIERDASADDDPEENPRDDSDDEDDVGPADEAVRNLAASVAACLHPCWCSRGSGLSLVHDPAVTALIRRYSEIAQGRVRTIEDADGPYITGNGSSTGFIMPEGVAALSQRLAARDPVLIEGLGQGGADALSRAFAYAVERGLGLIEAADLAIPGSGLSAAEADARRGNLEASPLRSAASRRARSKANEIPAFALGLGLLVATLLGAIIAYRMGASTDLIVCIVIVGGSFGIRALTR
jgi:hypothetical protein